MAFPIILLMAEHSAPWYTMFVIYEFIYPHPIDVDISSMSSNARAGRALMTMAKDLALCKGGYNLMLHVTEFMFAYGFKVFVIGVSVCIGFCIGEGVSACIGFCIGAFSGRRLI